MMKNILNGIIVIASIYCLWLIYSSVNLYENYQLNSPTYYPYIYSCEETFKGLQDKAEEWKQMANNEKNPLFGLTYNCYASAYLLVIIAGNNMFGKNCVSQTTENMEKELMNSRKKLNDVLIEKCVIDNKPIVDRKSYDLAVNQMMNRTIFQSLKFVNKFQTVLNESHNPQMNSLEYNPYHIFMTIIQIVYAIDDYLRDLEYLPNDLPNNLPNHLPNHLANRGYTTVNLASMVIANYNIGFVGALLHIYNRERIVEMDVDIFALKQRVVTTQYRIMKRIIRLCKMA